MNRQITDWEKIFAKHVSDIGLYFYKEDSHNLTLRRQTTHFLKWAKDLNRYFTKEDT